MIKNRKGVTLIELIIVTALLGLVIMIGFSIFSFGFRSFYAQADNLGNQSNVRHAIRDITREVRKVDNDDITTSTDSINVGGVIYSLQGSTLMKDGNELISGINSFYPSKTGNKITLEITSQAKRGHEFTLISEIYVRE